MGLGRQLTKPLYGHHLILAFDRSAIVISHCLGQMDEPTDMHVEALKLLMADFNTAMAQKPKDVSGLVPCRMARGADT